MEIFFFFFIICSQLTRNCFFTRVLFPINVFILLHDITGESAAENETYCSVASMAANKRRCSNTQRERACRWSQRHFAPKGEIAQRNVIFIEPDLSNRSDRSLMSWTVTDLPAIWDFLREAKVCHNGGAQVALPAYQAVLQTHTHGVNAVSSVCVCLYVVSKIIP